jgi:ornithine cyclodeaminase
VSTLLISRSQVEEYLNTNELLSLLKKGFKLYSTFKNFFPNGRYVSPLGPNQNNSAAVLFPGYIPEIPAYSVKINSKFPGQNPSITGLIQLFDIHTGQLLAIMDSSYITAVRTGLSISIGTDILAEKSANSVAIIGAGTQGSLQLKSLMKLRKIERAFVYDVNPNQSNNFAKALEGEVRIPIKVCSSVQNAIKDTRIIITATWAREPFIFSNMLIPGTHITTLGPDQPGKCEIDGEIIKNSLFVCDDKKLAVEMGAVGGAGLTEGVIDAELGDLLNGNHNGRTKADQTTVFGAVGLPFQDLAAAWIVYTAILKAKRGQTFNFLD